VQDTLCKTRYPKNTVQYLHVTNQPCNSALTDDDRCALLQLASDSIRHGLDTGRPLTVDPDAFATSLRPLRATFVTLEIEHQLRGCIGMLEAIRPLVVDVAENAWAAAFRDPRFAPVADREFEQLDIHISILSPSEPMQFKSQADLLRQIRPGVDGLILEDGRHRGTFLPSVWESLPDAQSFLAHLKNKAGLPVDYWSDTLRVLRYTTESVTA